MIWYVLGPAAKNSHRVSELCSVSLVAWRVPESLFYLSKGKCFGTFGRHLSAKETSLVQTFETQLQSPTFIHETPKIFATFHPVEETWPGSSGGVWEGTGTESVETRGDVTGRSPTNPVSACFSQPWHFGERHHRGWGMRSDNAHHHPMGVQSWAPSIKQNSTELSMGQTGYWKQNRQNLQSLIIFEHVSSWFSTCLN